MKFYGDLLRIIPLKNNTKLTILKSSKQINFCARFAFLKFILDHFVDYSEFIKFNNKLKRFIEKLKQVTETNKLSKRLTYLKFVDSFNQNVDKLPSSLTHIQFGKHFNQKVDNLPSSLTHLRFGWKFNQKVDNLPPSLTHLRFGINFNQLIDNLSWEQSFHVGRSTHCLQMCHTTPQKSIKIILFHENYKKFNHSLDHLKDVRVEYY
jgi:hypothetical protein